MWTQMGQLCGFLMVKLVELRSISGLIENDISLHEISGAEACPGICALMLETFCVRLRALHIF